MGFCLSILGEGKRPIAKTKTKGYQPKSSDVSILPIVFQEHEEEILV
jgi:hypothetical protein